MDVTVAFHGYQHQMLVSFVTRRPSNGSITQIGICLHSFQHRQSLSLPNRWGPETPPVPLPLNDASVLCTCVQYAFLHKMHNNWGNSNFSNVASQVQIDVVARPELCTALPQVSDVAKMHYSAHQFKKIPGIINPYLPRLFCHEQWSYLVWPHRRANHHVGSKA